MEFVIMVHHKDTKNLTTHFKTQPWNLCGEIVQCHYQSQWDHYERHK
jgi:hypothetical protein